MNTKKTLKKTIMVYSAVTLFCIVFSNVYSYLGHGVISNSMRLAFLYPLVLGVGVYTALYFRGEYERVSYNLYNAGVATLTVGSMYQGVIDIAGADTTYSVYYFMVGIPLIVVSLLFLFISKKS